VITDRGQSPYNETVGSSCAIVSLSADATSPGLRRSYKGPVPLPRRQFIIAVPRRDRLRGQEDVVHRSYEAFARNDAAAVEA
jgi:hypothetical protein